MLRRNEILTLAIGLLPLSVTPSSALAALTKFTDIATFEAAAGPMTKLSFDGIALPPSGQLSVDGSTVNGITFAGNAYIAGPSAASNGINWGTGAVLQSSSSATVTLSFAPTTAFGALFGSDLLLPYDVKVSFDGRSFVPLQINQTPTLAFFGWVSDTPFSFVYIRGGEGAPVMDDLTIASESRDLLEPGSSSLLGIALASWLALSAPHRRI